jgi:foldase protein PrsA
LKTRFVSTFAALGAASLLLVAVGCGGSGEVPDGTVAVVDGTEISEAELDELVARAKKGYEAADRDFPRVGTPEFQSLQTQFVEFLVQREEFEQAAEELDVSVSEKDKDDAVKDFIDSRFDGKRAEYIKALEEQGYTEEDFRETLAISVLSQKIYEQVTKDVEVASQDILAYYTQNQTQYRTPESRDVRHILIAEKTGEGAVDFAKSKAEADRIYAQLRGGADFAALAKQHSADPGSKATGGKLTISRGQTVPAFDETSFELRQGVVSRPVKTQYGYHLIEALSPVRKAKVTTLEEARPQIRAQLLSQEKQEVMADWVEELREDYEGKVRYAAGYEPPELPEPESTTTTESENQ